MSEPSDLDKRQTRFKTLRPLHNHPSESSIAHLFPNTSIRNRPLIGKSALNDYNTFTVSDSSTASQASRQVLHNLLETLRQNKIPGPRLIRLRREFNNRIGDGAQCDVFAASDDLEDLLEERSSDPLDTNIERSLRACKFIAVKQTKTTDYGGDSEDPSSGANVSRGLREQLEFAQRDILTLCKERVRRHPNIVKLLAWGLCLDTLEDSKGDSPRIPLLVLERANGNLGEYLQNEIELQGDHWAFATEQCKLCLDIGRGLEAIHEMNMTHGDLKLSNILIYQGSSSKYGATAKLCDFGLAIEEKKGEEIFTDYLGTPGWIPPESDETLPASSLVLCDVFAYGLVVWCVATLNLKSPIEGLAPRSLTEHHLYHRAFDTIPRAGILRSGQDTNRILHVLRGSLDKKPLLRERQPWRYLDRAQYPLISAVIDPTRGSTSLFAFNIMMQSVEWVSAASRKYITKIQSSWVPTYRYVYGILLSNLRWLFSWFVSRISFWGKKVTPLVHFRAPSPRQETYEKIVESYASSVRDGQPVVHTDSTDIMDDSLSATCDVSGIQKHLEDEMSSMASKYKKFGNRNNNSEVPLLASLHKTNDRPSNTRDAIPENVVYALARLRSRFSLRVWDSGVPSGFMPESSPRSLMNLSVRSNDRPKSSFNAVLLALESNLDVRTIAWLCKGPVGRREITSSRKFSLWRTVYEDKDSQISTFQQVQIIALLLQMGANADDCVSDVGPFTAFGRILRKLVVEDIKGNEQVETILLVCRLFRRSAIRSGSPQARYFFTGELPDEGDLDEAGAYLTTALHEAISACSYLAVQYLLTCQFPIYIQNRKGQTPLELAKAMASDMSRSEIEIKRESQRICDMIMQKTSSGLGQWNLPLGWTAKTLSSGRQIYEELHTDSITFKAPTFSLWQERRLTLGFKQLASMGQSFVIDLVRFISSVPEGFDEDSPDKSFVFDDRWFRADIRDTKTGKIDSSFGVPSWLSSLRSKAPLVWVTSMTTDILTTLTNNYLNIMLVFLPFSLAGSFAGWPNGLIVAFSSLSSVPLYSIHRFALRQTDKYQPRYVNSTMTAISDSLIEGILGIVAILHGEVSMAKYIVIGTTCNNVLLILGSSFLAAGVRYFQSPFNYQAASTRSTLLNLAVSLLLMVYTIDFVLQPSTGSRQDVLASIATGISITFVVVYVLYIFFRYRTHAQFYDQEYWVDDYQPDITDAPGLDTSDNDQRRGLLPSVGDDDRSSLDVPGIRYFTASFLALLSCALLILLANSIITHIIPLGTATLRFYGLFVVPVCLKAALHWEVIISAFNGRMDAALATTTDGALRVMYILFPIFIFLSRLLGYAMDMVFATDELIVTALATFTLNPIAARGTSTFLDGGLLLLIGVIVYLEQYLRPV